MFRLNTNVEKKDRSVVTLRDFKGLDTVHSPLNLSYKHATDMRNLINRNGVNRKRKGWRQEKAFTAGEMPAGTWSGVVDFSDDGTDKAEIIIHFAYNASGALSISAYKTEDGAEISITNHFTISSPTGQEIRAVYFETVEGSVTKGKVYAVGAGEILVIEPEKSGETYSLNVMGLNYIQTNNIVNKNGEALIPCPIVTQLGGVYLSQEQTYNKDSMADSADFADSWVLTAGIIQATDEFYPPTQENPEYDVNSIERDNVSIGYNHFKNEAINDVNVFSSARKNIGTVEITKDMASHFEAGDILDVEVFRLNELLAYSPANNTTDDQVTLSYYAERNSYYTNNIKIKVYINGKQYKEYGLVLHTVNDGATFILQDDTIAAYFAGKNFVVLVNNLYFLKDKLNYEVTTIDFEFTFLPREIGNTKQLKELISAASMITSFGPEGVPSRLFICDGSNVIIYSEYRNPLYIGTQNTITLGSTPITGWIKGAETSLYVFKKYSRQEENLYVIEGELVTSEENKYNVDEGEVVFRNHGYSLPESCVNQDCACSLANDVLVVSDDGVYGITLSANVASTERFARSRAEQIKNLLAEHDLTKAKCVVWDNKMFLAVDGLVFVADARFRASFDGDMSDTFNYEWWLWDNIPLKYWLVIQNKLCFVTEDNRLCCFYDGFSDYIQDELLVAVVDSSGLTAGGVTISSQYAEYNKIKFNNAFRECVPGVMRRGTSGGLIIANSYLYKDINEGDTIYFDFPNGRPTDPGWNMATPVQENVPYIVSDINIQTGEVLFETTEGEAIGFLPLPIGQIGSDAIRISKAADEEYNLRIDTEASENNAHITDEEGEEVKLIEYNAVSSYSATLYKKFPVVAYWQTGSYDFGSSIYSKTMERFSVAFDRESPKQLKLYYSTAYGAAVDPVKREIKNLRKNPDFDFGMFSFLRFAFDKKFETSYTRRFFINSFNFISFLLMSDEAEDFAVDSLSFTYKFKQLNRGEQ